MQLPEILSGTVLSGRLFDVIALRKYLASLRRSRSNPQTSFTTADYERIRQAIGASFFMVDARAARTKAEPIRLTPVHIASAADWLAFLRYCTPSVPRIPVRMPYHTICQAF